MNYSNQQSKVLIVIPCLNEVAHIERIVRFCHSEATHPESLIVITDGGSHDGTLEVLAGLQQRMNKIVVLDNPNKIQSSGVNLAVSTYGHNFELFVRIDVHAEYPVGYVSTLINEQKSTGASSVVVSMDTQGKSPIQKLIAETRTRHLAMVAQAIATPSMRESGSNTAIMH
ncbi:succinoglycan biosynthesis protein [Vibrio astriarenae]|nr:succinoglycan biosynthesis protein [Vibrio sp. C7]